MGRLQHLAARRGRFIARALLAVALSVILVAAAGGPIYVSPQQETPRHADAVLVLGGPGYARYGVGLALGEQGWAPTVVLSNPNGARDPWLSEFCSRRPTSFRLICFVPAPATTVGEGRELRRLAQENHWRSVIVVTFRPHVSRARFILSRCFDGELIMISSSTPHSVASWAAQYFWQTAGYLKAVFSPGC